MSCSTSRRPAESAVEQHAAVKALEEGIQGRERLLGARIDPQFRAAALVGKLRTSGSSPVSSVSALKASRVTAAKRSSAALTCAGSRNSSSGASTGRSMSWRRSS